jgi:hypothetical protein
MVSYFFCCERLHAKMDVLYVHIALTGVRNNSEIFYGPRMSLHGPRMSLQFRLFSRNCCHFRIAYEIKKTFEIYEISRIRNFVNTLIRIRESVLLTNDPNPDPVIFMVHPQNVSFQNVRFQNVWFQNVRFKNVRFTKRQVYKTSGLQMSGFKTSGFKTSNLYLLNKKYRNCQVCISI